MKNAILQRLEKGDKVFIGTIFFLVALTWFWLFKGKWPLGIPGDWLISVSDSAWPRGAWGLPVAAVFIFGGFAGISAYDRIKRAKNRREQVASTRLCFLGLMLTALLWPWALLGPGGTANLIASQWSDLSNEYFGTAQTIDDGRQFAREFAATRQDPDGMALAHVATHPPGAVLFYYGIRVIYEACPQLQEGFSNLAKTLTAEDVEKLARDSNQMRLSAARSAGARQEPETLPASAVGGALWAAFVISLLMSLATPAVYWVASSFEPDAPDEEVVRAESRGLIAAALWALCPTANLFAFTLDAVIAAGAAWALLFVALRWRNNQGGWMIASGITLALTSFVSFGALATGAIVVLAVASLLLWRDSGLRMMAAWKEALLFAIGFALTWFFIIAIFPFSPVHVFHQAMEAHHFATVSARHQHRWLWTAMNILTFAVFCGWPLMAASVRTLLPVQDENEEPKDFPLARIVGVAGLVTMLLLTLSGNVLGEVERLWMFLAPALAILAACALMRRANALIIGTCLVLQASQTLIMAAWLWPIVRPL